MKTRPLVNDETHHSSKRAGAPDIGPRLRMKEPSWVFSVRGGQPGIYRYSTHREGLLAWSKWTIFQKKGSRPCYPKAPYRPVVRGYGLKRTRVHGESQGHRALHLSPDISQAFRGKAGGQPVR